MRTGQSVSEVLSCLLRLLANMRSVRTFVFSVCPRVLGCTRRGTQCGGGSVGSSIRLAEVEGRECVLQRFENPL